MTALDHPTLEDLHQRTTAMITAIDDTPLEGIDHGHYQHYCEELRLLVEVWLTATSATPVDLPDQTWVVTRHGVVVGVCTTGTAAALTGGSLISRSRRSAFARRRARSCVHSGPPSRLRLSLRGSGDARDQP